MEGKAGSPSHAKKSYCEEFKREAVRMAYDGNHSSAAQVARDLGLCRSLLGKWRRQIEAAEQENSGPSGSSTGLHAFPGHGNPRDEELARLQRENARLKEEVEILKKAVGIFTSRPK
jgi:transposase